MQRHFSPRIRDLDPDEPFRIHGNRSVERVEPGERSRLWFWSAVGPAQTLELRQGLGKLCMLDGDSQVLSYIGLAANHPEANACELAPGTFYALKAPLESEEPLVVVGEPADAEAPLEELLVELQPDQREVRLPQGLILDVPSRFRELF